MHKDTCFAIKSVMDITGRAEYFRINIDCTKAQGSWFWSMKIVCKTEKKKHLLSHVKRISMDVGRFNGEELWESLKARTLKLS